MWNDMYDSSLPRSCERRAAPARHELLRDAYLAKVRARHEAKARAATTGAVLTATNAFAARFKQVLAALNRGRTSGELARPAVRRASAIHTASN